jgi:DNA-nicking Smr family endonuclease
MRRASLDDADLWRRAMHGVAPLANPRRRPASDPAPPPLAWAGLSRGDGEREETDVGRVTLVRPPPIPPDHSPSASSAGVDRRTAERLRRGRYPVEDRLDLHGMTQNEAHRALSGFVATARAGGKRCVLLITGNGRMSGGVLKAAVPRWLAEPPLRAQVLLLAPARPPHGGAGALYVLLRRAER